MPRTKRLAFARRRRSRPTSAALPLRSRSTASRRPRRTPSWRPTASRPRQRQLAVRCLRRSRPARQEPGAGVQRRLRRRLHLAHLGPLIGVGNSLIVENNYGYDVLGFQTGAVQSKPGLMRIDIDADKNDCHVVRTSSEIIPSVISKLSLTIGLIYTYTRKVDENGVQGWYWTAVDFRTGETAYSVLAGTGPRWNNHYAAIAIGPDGTQYTSGFSGGLSSMRDGS